MNKEKAIDKKKIILLSGIAAYIVLMIIATFFDLQINNVVADLNAGEYYSRNIFGRIFDDLGALPVYMLVAIAFGVIFFYSDKIKDKAYRYIVKFVCALMAFIFWFLLVRKFVSYIAAHYNYEDKLDSAATFAFSVAGLILCLLTLYVLSKQDKETIARLYVWSLIIIFTAAISQAFAQGIKVIASRPRYCTMAILEESGDGGFFMYKRWYQFSGIKKVSERWLELGIAADGLKSFPSGHVASTTMLVTLLALPDLLPGLNEKKPKIILWCVAVAAPIIVAISRMVMGAHFLSDVLVGGAITVVSYWIAKGIVKNKAKKLGIKEEKNRVVLCEELIEDITE